jgi:hypothetical protein
LPHPVKTAAKTIESARRPSFFMLHSSAEITARRT